MEIVKNKEYIVDIIDNGFEGEGIAKIDGFTIFIPNAIKGEKARILIVKVNKNFAYGKILEVLEASDSRVEEDCDTYVRCGGCNLRHIKYEDTLKMKKAVVENCLYKELKRDVEVNEVLGMDEPKFYRNKLIYPVGTDKNGETIMGVFANRSHNIIEVKECLIQDKLNQEIANTVLEVIKRNNIKPYNEELRGGKDIALNKRHGDFQSSAPYCESSFDCGNIRHIIVRNGKVSNEVMVVLVCNEKAANKVFEDDLVKALTTKYPQVKSIVKNINDKNTNVIMGEKNDVLYGDGYITDVLDGYTFKISPHSFYQVNPVQTVKLYNTAVEKVDLKKADVVWDLYCGIGTISIFLAKYVNKVIGIEIVEAAIEDAKENAKLNDIDNIDFYAGDVEKVLPKILEDKANFPDVIFVDPPRKGLDNNTINLIKSVKPRKVVYISCNPATLARDIALLEEEYELKNVQPVDMFCFTSHVENVAVLEVKC